MNLQFVSLLAAIMIPRELFAQQVPTNSTQVECDTLFPWPPETTSWVAIGLFVYSAITTVCAACLACCLWRIRIRAKVEVNQYREHTWSIERVPSGIAASRDMHTEIISLNSNGTEIIEHDMTSEHASSFGSCRSNGTSRLSGHPDSGIAIPLPSVISEEQTQSTETQRGSPKDSHKNSSPQRDKTNETLSSSLVNNTCTCPQCGREMELSKDDPRITIQDTDRVSYVNSGEGSVHNALRPESSAYASVQDEVERHYSVDSSNYENVSFIKRSSSLHEYQYVDNKARALRSNNIGGEASAALESIDEEEGQKRKKYVSLKNETRISSGTFYESLEADKDICSEDLNQTEKENGFYTGLSAEAIEKYTKLSQAVQNDLRAQFKLYITKLHAKTENSAKDGDQVDDGKKASGYIYIPDYLTLISDDTESLHDDDSKKEAPMKYLNAEKSPGYMACITELKRKESNK